MDQHALILDPSAPATRPENFNARALDDIRGKVVSFIDNTKPNFNLLSDDMADLLVSQHGAAGVIRYRKRAPSDGVSAAVLAEIADKCNLVIAGSGD
ncbi:MAG: hypothetical protein EHM59_10075 [Betaproteobacteria bacterium]|nr:MAG: hypothetical protein EHM59_10075 [Betaproteobacteria bacterium]